MSLENNQKNGDKVSGYHRTTLLNKHLVSTCYVQGTVLEAAETAVTRTRVCFKGSN